MHNNNVSELMSHLEPLDLKYGTNQLRSLLGAIDPPGVPDVAANKRALMEDHDVFIDGNGNVVLGDSAAKRMFNFCDDISYRAWQAHPEAYLLLLPVAVIQYWFSLRRSSANASDRRQPRPCVNHSGFYIDEYGMMYKFVNGEFVECDMELPDTGPIFFDHEAGMLEPDPRRELFETFIGPVQKNWRIVPLSGDYCETGLEELLIRVEKPYGDNNEVSRPEDFRYVMLVDRAAYNDGWR